MEIINMLNIFINNYIICCLPPRNNSLYAFKSYIIYVTLFYYATS